jgi:hypothetical protein
MSKSSRFSRVLLVPVALVLAVTFVGTARGDEASAKKYKNGWEYRNAEGTGGFYCNRPMGEGYGAPWTEGTSTKGKSFNFVQVCKTSDYVVLYDKSREMTVILTDDMAYVLFPGSKGARPLIQGKWIDVTY